MEALRQAGAEVLGIVSIFTYGMKKGLDRLKEANIENTSLCDLDALLKVAVESGWDLNDHYVIDEKDFLSKGKASPFKGMEVYGRCLKTVCEGRTVYEYKGE